MEAGRRRQHCDHAREVNEKFFGRRSFHLPRKIGNPHLLSSSTRSVPDFSVAFSTRQRTWKDSLSHPALLILHRAPLFSTSIFKFSCLHFHRLPFSSTSSTRVLNELGHTPPSHHAHVCPACFSGIELQERQSEVVIAISTVESGY